MAKTMNYKGFDYEYDELFGWTVYDENGTPVSHSFESLEEVKAAIDAWVA